MEIGNRKRQVLGMLKHTIKTAAMLWECLKSSSIRVMHIKYPIKSSTLISLTGPMSIEACHLRNSRWHQLSNNTMKEVFSSNLAQMST